MNAEQLVGEDNAASPQRLSTQGQQDEGAFGGSWRLIVGRGAGAAPFGFKGAVFFHTGGQQFLTSCTDFSNRQNAGAELTVLLQFRQN
jgi:hypothetical protein